MAPTTSHTGGCLCGSVRYVIDGDMRPVVYCHCVQCRKTSGNYVAATNCDNAQLTLENDTTLRWYASSPNAKRGFCSECGSNLFWQANDSAGVSIFAGSLDSAEHLDAVAHIYVESVADYLSIKDGLPQYDQVGPDEVMASTK